MKKINRRGFTLIELLAVIIILGLVMVVTIPSVINAVKASRQEAYDDAIKIIEKYVNNAYVECYLEATNNINFEGTTLFDKNCLMKGGDEVISDDLTVSDFILKETNFQNDISSVSIVCSNEDEECSVYEALVTDDGKFKGVEEKKFKPILNPTNPFRPRH